MASEILFVYDFDLLVDDLPGKPVDRHKRTALQFIRINWRDPRDNWFALAKMPVIWEIWVSVKTTIKLPEALFRRAKSMAAQEGVTLEQLLTEALESRLDVRRRARNGKSTAPRWMRAYGALRHLRQERKAIERTIESEFEKIEPQDRL